MAMTSWVSLCEAAGLPVRTMEPMEIFHVAKRITEDEWLTTRCKPFITKGVLHKDVRERILQGCTQLELQALRERVRQ